MTLKEYLQDKTLTSVQVCAGTLFTVNTDQEGTRSVDSDTSHIVMGTPVTVETEFNIEESTLTVGESTFNLNELSVVVETVED